MEELEMAHVQNTIGYHFRDTNLLVQAFTRKSYTEENGGENNEVLEFIGDAVLNFFAVKTLIMCNSNSRRIMEKYDNSLIGDGIISGFNMKRREELRNTSFFECEKSEGELSELKKIFVQKRTLAMKIDELGIGQYLLMGKGDRKNNAGDEKSVKEDLFEAILGAVAVDSGWNMEKLEACVSTMLSAENILNSESGEDYVALIYKWSQVRYGRNPLYKCADYHYTMPLQGADFFRGVSQNINMYDSRLSLMKYQRIMKLGDELPEFRGLGETPAEANLNVCRVAYEYLIKNGKWLLARDEIKNPNKDDAINQLEILARRGYFSLPFYDFKMEYDKDGNPVWMCICNIKEKNKKTKAKSSSKKEAKKLCAYEMLGYVLDSEKVQI